MAYLAASTAVRLDLLPTHRTSLSSLCHRRQWRQQVHALLVRGSVLCGFLDDLGIPTTCLSHTVRSVKKFEQTRSRINRIIGRGMPVCPSIRSSVLRSVCPSDRPSLPARIDRRVRPSVRLADRNTFPSFPCIMEQSEHVLRSQAISYDHIACFLVI